MSVSFDKICRLCMIDTSSMVSLFEDENLPNKIMDLIPTLKIFQDDNLPSQICQKCMDQIINFDKFKLQCENSDVTLNKYLNNQQDENKNAEEQEIWVSSKHEMSSESSILEEGEMQNDWKKIDEDLENKLICEVKEEPSTDEIKIEIISDSEIRDSVSIEKNVKDDTGINNLSEIRKGKFREKTVPCYICGKILVYRRRNEHIRRHTEGKTFKCNKCEKMFLEKHELKKHFLVHSDLKDHMCDICGRRFKCLNTLKVHQETHKEQRQKSHICDICGKAFTHIGNFRVHKLLHTGVKPFICDICGKNFAQKISLQIHLAVHSGQKQHECEICGKGFIRKGHLLTHMVVHTGERKFSCDICGMTYKRSHSLKKHKRKHEELQKS